MEDCLGAERGVYRAARRKAPPTGRHKADGSCRIARDLFRLVSHFREGFRRNEKLAVIHVGELLFARGCPETADASLSAGRPFRYALRRGIAANNAPSEIQVFRTRGVLCWDPVEQC